MSTPRVTIVGGSVEVVADLVATLLARGLRAEAIALLGDDETCGEVVEAAGRRFPVREVAPAALAAAEIVLLCGSPRLAAGLVPVVRDRGALCVDASGATRGIASIAPIVPEVNGELLRGIAPGSVVGSPAPAAVALALVLAPLHRLAGVRRVVATVLEPAAQRGAAAIEDLSREAVGLLSGRGFDRAAGAERLAFNLRVQTTDEVGAATRDEEMLGRALPQVLDAPDLDLHATVVRASVFLGTAISVYVELGGETAGLEVETALRAAPGVLLAGSPEDALARAVASRQRALGEGDGGAEGEDDAGADGWPDEDGDPDGGDPSGDAVDLGPGPIEVSGSEFVHVSRLRPDSLRPGAVSFWIAFDEMRRGVVLNLAGIVEATAGAGG